MDGLLEVRWARPILLAGLGAIAFLCWAAPATYAADTGKVVNLPVSFQVKNTDTSEVVCPSDGASYTVRGHISGPRSALIGDSSSRAISVYLTGLETGEWNWRFSAVPGYDSAEQMAKLGHVSLTIDMLGYGASGHPLGAFDCYGSQADVVHQIIEQLRSGNYQAGGGAAVKFSRVVLVGHDVGGLIAQIEAYSYKDINGLVVATWADQGQTPLIIERFLRASAVCATGGENAQPGGPGGYFFMERPPEYQPDLFYNADPAVIAGYLRMRERNPCGYVSSTQVALDTDMARLGEIHVPVLLTIGAEDKIWTQDGWAQQKGHFTGTDDVTAVTLANTGHYPMLEQTAPEFRRLLSNWLNERRF